MDILSPAKQQLLKDPAISAALDKLLDGPFASVCVTMPDGQTYIIRRVAKPQEPPQ